MRENRIVRTKLTEFAVREKWPEKLLDTVARVLTDWDEHNACEVAFFISGNGSSMKVDCYSPDFCQAGLPDGNVVISFSKKKPPLVLPLDEGPSDSYTRRELAFRAENWNRDEILVVVNSQGNIMQPNNPQKSELLQREVASLKRTMTNYYAPLFARDDAFRKKYLAGMVRLIEDMEREADELSGFVDLQKRAHRLSIVIPETKKKGQFTAGFLGRIMERIQTVTDEVSQLYNIPFRVDVVAKGMAQSSSVIFADIEGENPEDILSEDVLFELEKRLATILRDATLYLREEDKDKAGDKFVEETKLSAGKASKVVKALRDIAPGPGADSSVVRILLPYQNLSHDIEAKDRKEFSKALKRIDSVKRDEDQKEDRIFEGELGGVEEFTADKIHFFTIQPAGKKAKTKIHYSPTKSNQKKVENALQSEVKVQAKWESGRWYLARWLR